MFMESYQYKGVPEIKIDMSILENLQFRQPHFKKRKNALYSSTPPKRSWVGQDAPLDPGLHFKGADLEKSLLLSPTPGAT